MPQDRLTLRCAIFICCPTDVTAIVSSGCFQRRSYDRTKPFKSAFDSSACAKRNVTRIGVEEKMFNSVSNI